MKQQLVLGMALAAAVVLTPSMTLVVEAQATAPASIAFAPGEEKEVCAGVKAAVTPAPKHGVLRSGEPAADGTIKIFYKAKDTTTAVSEALTCTAGTEKKEIKVSVAAKAASDTPNQTTGAGRRNDTSGFSDDTYPEAFKALFLLFVLATVLESALAIVFNWRPFVETFNSRAVKPLVSFGFAMLIVYMFNLDLLTALARLIQPAVPALDDTGRVLTAMVVAGGSAAVNNLMVALGFRQVRTPETVVPKPPPDKGWISVSIVRTAQIQGPVTVGVGVATPDGKVPVVASLSRSTRPSLRYFLRDGGRFPGSGGYAVKKGDPITVKVSARRANSDDDDDEIELKWGPHPIAEGAIVDLTFTMAEESAVAQAVTV